MSSRSLIPALIAAAAIVVPNGAQAQNKLIVAMPTTPPNIVHMPVHIANDLGLFKKYGLEIKVVELAGGVYTFRAMVAGSADVASASGPFSIVGRAKGAKTKAILANMPKLEASMIVGKDIKTMADLKGKRIGIPQWTQTAVTYVRGWLQHEAGVPLTSIDWVQAGVNDAGRKEMATFELPAGFKLTSMQDKSLGELLLSGGIDAMISARPPNVFLDGRHGVKRLIPDYRAQELAYFQKTGIFPIMHVIVMRRDAYEANRWIARNLLEAFEKSKRACLPELYQGQTSFLPTAWGNDHVEETNRLLFPDGDPWPYGIERNRKTLEPFLAFCHEQGVTRRKLAVEELFPKEVSVELKI